MFWHADRRRLARVSAAVLATALVLGTTAAMPSAEADASGIVSDEFNGSLDTSRWRFVNPLGDASVNVSNGHANLTVPAGTAHDLWKNAFDAPGLRQAAPNTDFEVEAKYDSAVTAGYQMQGIVVWQDDANFVRLDVYHNGSGVRIFGATIAGTSAKVRVDAPLAQQPAYLRVARAGNVWTLKYSLDGSAWQTAATFSHAMTVNGIGPFAGNAGSPAPGHVASVDYFRNVGSVPPPTDTTPPVISGVSVAPTATGATVTWNTNELATSRVDYGSTAALGSNVSNATPKTAHSLSLTGLTCASTYHYVVTSVDGSGNSASTTSTTFQTSTCPAPPSGITTDQFDGPLDTNLWTFIDPRGDASVAVTGGRAELSVPAGITHDLWKNQIHSPWIRQAAPNADFEVEVKFDSDVVSKYQMQGVIVAQDATTLLRFDAHYDGSSVRLYAATINSTSAKQKINVSLAQTPNYLRIQRAGNVWTLSYSATGTTWQTAGSFSHTMTVTGIGPFAGNAASPAPAHTAIVDYFANVSEAPPPPPPDDTVPPVISGVSANPGSSSATVTWTTNESATSRVDYGTSTSFGFNVTSATLKTSHSLLLLGLACNTTYNYKVTSVDASGNPASSTTRTFQTGSCGDLIDIWYGSTQHVGQNGRTQEWVNLQGNVASSVTSLSYRLNGGPSRDLTIGPDARRLNRPGDFNADIDFDDLQTGTNLVVLTAVTAGGSSVSETVTVVRHNTVPSLPYSTNFGAASNVNDVVHASDGHWTLEGNSLRIAEMGYDRLALIGDLSWRDYEVTVPVTVHGLSPDAYAPQHGSPVVGLALRWQGHSQFDPSDPSQPAWWWWPTGAFAWFKYPATNSDRFELTGNMDAPIVRKVNESLPFGVPHYFKVRVETTGGGTTQYSAKWWPVGQAEPGWLLTLSDTGPATGSIGLLAHDLDASFGNVTVTPL